MTTLENLTAGVTLFTGTILPDTITMFTGEPLVYFVAAFLVYLAFVMIKRTLLPEEAS